jgi:serine/threonine-protein kinase
MKIGERIGDYEIVEVLGTGGMGEVYKVRNVLSERFEAMKVLLPNLAGNPELAERFLREIKMQASLDHPNIAKLHTAFRDGNRLLMVMEFVEGLPLEKLLASGPVLTSDALSYAGQVLDALAYAHGRGVIHRDIKPANLMRTSSGTIKLLDFGIAHMKADPKLTQTGTTVGSLYYIAPELIKGAEPDPRCDIYSLGVVLYEMVTGRKPFTGDSQYSIMAAHMEGAPAAPADSVPWIPGPLSDVILKAIAKDPAARFQSAEAFKAALEAAPASAVDQAATQVVSASTVPLPVAPPPLVLQTQPASTVPVQAVAPPPTLPARSALASQPQAPVSPTPVPPRQPGSANRGLYVALGCLLTLGVLAAAAVEGPKFFRTHADQAASRQPASLQPAPPADSTTPPQEQPSATPEVTTPASPAPPTDSTQNASSQPVTQPSSTQPVSARPANHKPSHDQPAGQAQPSGPSDEAKQSYQGQMSELKDRADLMTVRAKTARAGLSSIKSQMAAQGLGLRSDVLAAESRMNYFLDKAQRDISSGDAVSAEHDLEMAGYAADYIEKFLGH